MNLIEHIEKYLGAITSGESVNNDEFGKLIFCKFQNQPNNNITTYLTLGLSDHILNLKEKKWARMELLAGVYSSQENSKMNDLLLYISDRMLRTHNAILRGQAIGIPDNIFDNKGLKSVYVSIPVFFEDGFATFEETTPATIFAWIFPLYENERDFINKNGWNKFEDELEVADCDFWNLNRKPLDI
ncbi:suppressor of fused domain protein [Chryseobacterium bernardetii]|uniref:suppressor of fused domain protein n=1 Tax=Chryseobacterium bernardetii TaxID=1241978 RepID=UPI00162942FD|nr:suppressor of fused domain protein [Chryseobacterium bernardetii]